MGCYHFHLNQISRSNGSSAVASAAYRAGEKLYDDYYGEVQDYTRKEGVVLTEILLPPHAPDRFQDRQTLWNELESVEKNYNAQLAHSFNMTLMEEFSMEENIDLARRFVQEQLVARGMIADLAVHAPKNERGESYNPHIHIMVPIRPLNEDGTWGNKQKKLPVLDEEGNQAIGENGNPKMRAVPTTDWSSKETLLALREAWARYNNELYEAKGLDERIDWRSYEDQGLPFIPTLHEGPQIRAMEKKGIQTEIGSMNRIIRAINEAIRQSFHLYDWIKETAASLGEQIRKKPEPTLACYLQAYYDRRDLNAENFAYGTKKAKLTNLKEFASVISFLTTEGIATEKELEDQIFRTQQDIQKFQKDMSEHQKKISTLQKLLRDAAAFPKLEAVKKEYDKKFWQKEKFRKEHEKEIRRYYAVEKELSTYRDQAGDLPIKEWQRRLENVSSKTNETELQMNQLKEKLSMLKRVRRCIDQVMDTEQDTGGKKSIHDRLADNRAKIESGTRTAGGHKKKDMEIE